MLSPGENASPRVKAENRGHGNQFLTDGPGDQNVATDSGVVYSIGQLNSFGIPPIGHLSQLLEGAKNWSQGPTCEDMVRWLMRQPDKASLDSDRHHGALRRQAVKATGEWILANKELLDWKDPSSPTRFLCMHGMLGSGKTMLVSLIVDWIKEDIKSRTDAAYAYFYFQEGEKHRVPLACIWATLLKQLLSQGSGHLADELKAKFNDSLQGSTPLSPDDYLDLFRAQAATVKTVYLIIDALDSCQDIPGEETQQGMRVALNTLPDSIRVLFTSRNDWAAHEIGTDQKLSIPITPKPQDVKAYVKSRIENDKFLSRMLEKDDDKRKVISDVTNMTLSSRMFLLARLHMDNLREQYALVDIRAALRQLPDSAFQVFEASAKQIAQEIGSEKNDRTKGLLAKHILTWVVHAKTELNAEQIRDIIAVQKSNGLPYQDYRPLKERLMPACMGLVIMDPEKETLSLVHKSVRMHLQKYNITPENPDLEMAKTCLSYLLVDPCAQAGEPPGEPPLLRYAAKYWWSHLRCGGREIDQTDQDASSLMLRFLMDHPKLARAFQAMDGTDGASFENMTGLHAAVHFNLRSWAENLFRLKVDVNAKCSDGQTALHWAVRYGRHELIELLIRESADPNVCDKAGDTPLHKALIGPTADGTPLQQAVVGSVADIESAVRVLVKNKARLDICNKKGRSPLASAVRYGPTSIAKIMIESQDDVNAEIFEGGTSLRLVFYHGQDSIQLGGDVAARKGSGTMAEGWVQLRHAVGNHARLLTDLLLERGVDLNRPSAKDRWTPLVHAARTGDSFKLRCLLTRKPDPADVHLQGQEGKSPLWWALSHKKAAAIQLLAEYGADLNETYDDGTIPLSKAIAQQDGSDTTLLLVRLGADVNKRTAGKSTLLIDAVKLRNQDMVWVLLNAGARPDETDAAGWSALLYAIKNRDIGLIWLLIAKGASVAKPSQGGRSGGGGKRVPSPIELAIDGDETSVAWLLCENGASPIAADDQGVTPLHRAAKSGRVKAARFLVDRGAAADTMDSAKSTPLHHAVLSGCDEAVALLASPGPRAPRARRVRLDILDGKGNTPLTLATLQKRPAAMRTLLQHGARCGVSGPGGLTALHHAANLGFSEGLRLLLDGGSGNGNNPNAADDAGFTPLHHAVNGGRADPDLVGILARAGANLEARDRTGRTPLMLAAQLGREPLARCLLAEGADPQTRNRNGWVAADFAGEFLGIQKLLQEWLPQTRRRPSPAYRSPFI